MPCNHSATTLNIYKAKHFVQVLKINIEKM